MFQNKGCVSKQRLCFETGNFRITCLEIRESKPTVAQLRLLRLRGGGGGGGGGDSCQDGPTSKDPPPPKSRSRFPLMNGLL